MSVVDEIMGRRPLNEDAPPVQAARPHPASPTRKEAPSDKESKKLRDQARRSSVVAGIVGMTENDNEGIIPDDAKQVDPFSTHQIPGLVSAPAINSAAPSEPALSNAHGEELIPPTAALVAPDVTPKVFQLVDPSQIPAPPKPTGTPPGAPTVTNAPPAEQGALDTILGREQDTPAFAESYVDPGEIKSMVAEKMVPAAGGGSTMPEHKQGDGRTIFGTFRRLVG